MCPHSLRLDAQADRCSLCLDIPVVRVSPFARTLTFDTMESSFKTAQKDWGFQAGSSPKRKKRTRKETAETSDDELDDV